MKVLLFFLLFAASVSAQSISLTKGIVMDSIPVSDTLDATFALYLPSQFDGSTPYASIFIFDSEGRGKSAAHLFVPAAEQQNYILVSSNAISSDKSLEENLVAAIELIQGAHRLLPLDVDNIYTAGFGEGAKVATSVPLVLKDVAGVLYIGDQHFNFDLLKKGISYSTIGVVGNRQAELYTIRSVAEGLALLTPESHLYVFDGEKEWPGPDVISSAVGSLTLDAMIAKKRPMDEGLVEQLFHQDLDRLNKLIQEEQYLMAREFLDSLPYKYPSRTFGKEFKKKIRERKKQLRHHDGVEEQEKRMAAVIQKQSRLLMDFAHYLEEDVAAANFDNLGWWNFQRMELEKLTEGVNTEEAAMASRILEMLQYWAEGAVKEQSKKEALENKMFANMLATIFDKHNYEAYLNIVSLSAKDGDFSTALYYLEELLKGGYANREALYNIDGTLGLKTSKEFNWLIKKYLGSSKYYNNATSLY